MNIFEMCRFNLVAIIMNRVDNNMPKKLPKYILKKKNYNKNNEN